MSKCRIYLSTVAEVIGYHLGLLDLGLERNTLFIPKWLKICFRDFESLERVVLSVRSLPNFDRPLANSTKAPITLTGSRAQAVSNY